MLVLLDRLKEINQIGCGPPWQLLSRLLDGVTLCRRIRRPGRRCRFWRRGYRFSGSFGFLLCKILSPIDLEIWIIQVIFQRIGQRRGCMLQLWDLQSRRRLVLSCKAQILHYLFRLLSKSLVNLQCPFCIGTRHFKIMLWTRKLAFRRVSYRRNIPKTLIVPSFMTLKSSSRSSVNRRKAVRVISLSGS